MAKPTIAYWNHMEGYVRARQAIAAAVGDDCVADIRDRTWLETARLAVIHGPIRGVDYYTTLLDAREVTVDGLAVVFISSDTRVSEPVRVRFGQASEARRFLLPVTDTAGSGLTASSGDNLDDARERWSALIGAVSAPSRLDAWFDARCHGDEVLDRFLGAPQKVEWLASLLHLCAGYLLVHANDQVPAPLLDRLGWNRLTSEKQDQLRRGAPDAKDTLDAARWWHMALGEKGTSVRGAVIAGLRSVTADRTTAVTNLIDAVYEGDRVELRHIVPACEQLLNLLADSR